MTSVSDQKWILLSFAHANIMECKCCTVFNPNNSCCICFSTWSSPCTSSPSNFGFKKKKKRHAVDTFYISKCKFMVCQLFCYSDVNIEWIKIYVRHCELWSFCSKKSATYLLHWYLSQRKWVLFVGVGINRLLIKFEGAICPTLIICWLLNGVTLL